MRRTLRYVLFVGLVLLPGGLAAIAVWIRGWQPPDAWQVYVQGRAAIAAAAWSEVDACIRQLRDHGHEQPARLLQAEKYLARQQPAAALALLQAAPWDDAWRVDAAIAAGRAQLLLGELDEAYRLLSWASQQQPDHPDVHRGLAAIAYDLGQLYHAEQHLRRVAELDPDDPRPWRTLGLIYKDLSQYQQAEVAYREALRRPATGALRRDILCELAEVLVQAARYAEALELLQSDATLAASDSRAAHLHAQCLYSLGRLDEAAPFVERHWPAEPSAEWWLLRGRLHQAGGNWSAARAAWLEALRKQPHGHDILYALGQASTALQEPDQARQYFAQAEAVQRRLERLTALTRQAMEQPWNAAVRQQLADEHNALGQKELAEMWRRAAQACQHLQPRQ